MAQRDHYHQGGERNIDQEDEPPGPGLDQPPARYAAF
jgi:hypothetical protein